MNEVMTEAAEYQNAHWLTKVAKFDMYQPMHPSTDDDQFHSLLQAPHLAICEHNPPMDTLCTSTRVPKMNIGRKTNSPGICGNPPGLKAATPRLLHGESTCLKSAEPMVGNVDWFI